MKKHLIAAAVAAAVAVPAAAQVTVYGTIDYAYDVRAKSTAVTTETNAATSAGGNRNGTSRIGFRATEDLGGGLKVTAVSEHSLSAANVLGGRDQYVELAGGFGTVKFGQLDQGFNAGYGSYATAISTNGVGTSDSSGHDLMAGTLGADSSSGTFARQSGVLQYTSPSFSGLTALVEVARSKSEAASAVTNTNAEMTNLRLDYKLGKLSLILGSGTRKVDASSTDNVQDEGKANYFGAAYDVGVAQIKFVQGNRKDLAAGVGTTDVTVNNFAITVPMGAISLRASAYDGEDKVTAASTTDNMDLSGYQVGAVYSLSKRTSAYAYVGKNSSKLSAGGTTGLEEAKATYVGITHSF